MCFPTETLSSNAFRASQERRIRQIWTKEAKAASRVKLLRDLRVQGKALGEAVRVGREKISILNEIKTNGPTHEFTEVILKASRTA